MVWCARFFALKITESVRSALQRLPKQTRVILLTTVYGGGAGLMAVAFQLGMNSVHRFGLVSLSKESPKIFVLGSFVITLGTALLVGWLLDGFCKEAAGSGVPQLKAAFWRDFGFVPARVIWVKFLAGVLQIGGGSSLGREGPSVQLAGAVGSNLAGWAGEPKQSRRSGAATGAAAGLAAAFNTPLAAVTFVLEELIGDLNSRLLGGVLLAALVGALVTHGILGPQPAFSLSPLGEPSWRAYGLLPIVATVAALIGVLFQKSALGFRKRIGLSTQVPKWLRPCLGALVCWILGTIVFLKTGRLGVFGLGYDDLSDVLAGKLAWQIATLLLVAKFFATVACYSTGGCGGIFSPTLFFGATAGLAVAGAAQMVIPLKPEGIAMLSVVGMSATLGAVVRAPVTSILIVFEMTHEFALVPPLMLGALISQAVSRRLLRRNFYDSLLEQDGHDVQKLTPPRDIPGWHRQALSVLATSRPIILESLDPLAVRRVLTGYPYQLFPVVENGQCQGALSRQEAQNLLEHGSPPKLVPVVVCRATETLREAESKMVAEGASMTLIASADGERWIGVLTLHDLLRAQLAASENSSL